jgi:hypothetical protein
LEEERVNIKSEMFNNELMKFEKNEALSGEEFLGKLKYITISYTLIRYL